MIKYCIGKDMEVNGSGLIFNPYHSKFPKGTERNYENLTQNIQSPVLYEILKHK
jgi:hypothetical protein